MANARKLPFDPEAVLAKVGEERSGKTYAKGQAVFA
jgi:hypothetical protein